MPRRKDEKYYKDVKLTVDTYAKLQNVYKVAEALSISPSAVSRRLSEAENLGIHTSSDMEIVLQNVVLAKQKQGLQDIQRVERKAFREYARVENAVSEYYKEMRDLLKSNVTFHNIKTKSEPKKTDAVLVVHWSDHHLNERVELPHNIYDWQIASKRLKKHVIAAKRIANAYGIKHIHVQFTGDLINSDRRNDEVMANAGNRVKATVLATDLYAQAIVDLSADFYVTYSGISGNESRVPKDVSWVAEGATDNYDFQIYEMLDLLLGKKIPFFRPDNPSESVINIAGKNILTIHGHGAIGVNGLQKAVQEIKGRYISNGIRVDFVFWGHIHEAVIADWYGRSASLVGSNTFNENALNLAGRASQNVYVIHRVGGFDGIKIDLQNTDGVIGYDLDMRLEAYNTKAAKKLHQPKTIMEIVI
jgi:predicted phosphodiesterase/DNA-binding Lrp family transcriptional regulator